MLFKSKFGHYWNKMFKNTANNVDYDFGAAEIKSDIRDAG